MATADQQGIMALPQGAPAPEAQAAPQMGMDDSYDAVRQGLQNASPQAAQGVQELMSQITPQLDQLSDEELDTLLQTVQYLYDNEKDYQTILQQLIAKGLVGEGDLPEEYDPEFLATLGTVLIEARRTRNAGNEQEQAQMPMPPEGMARGGIAEAARMVASRGRTGDTMLAHINQDEARMLRAHGGMGTINPSTGLPEYGNFLSNAWNSVTSAVSSVFKGVIGAVKQIVASPIGRVLATVALATFLGPGAFGITGMGFGATASMAIASGAITAIGGGNLKDIAKSALIGGATAYFAAPGGAVSNAVGSAGISNVAANAAVSAGIVGTGAGLLTGKSLSDSIKSGITAGAIAGGVSLASSYMAPVPGNNASVDVKDVGTVNGPKPVSLAAAQSQTQGAANAVQPVVSPANFDLGEFAGVDAQVAAQKAAGPAPITNPAVNNPPPPPPNGEPSYWDQAKDFFKENSPSGIKAAGTEAAQKAGMDAVARLPEGTPEGIKTATYQKYYDAAMPGVFSTYGPAVGAGLGVMALAGGFTPKPVPQTALQNDINTRLADEKARVAANPGSYAPQGMEKFGIIYNDKGEITGSRPWSPSSTGPSEVAATNYVPFKPSVYSAPQGAVGSRTVEQPYNNTRMYDFMPRYAAMGGIADLGVGGYPRRTGQISGPGTATSDSIPAMLSDGEFVMTAKAVRNAGKGSRLAGAKKMYALMNQLERNAARG